MRLTRRPDAAALYECKIAHARTAPVRNAFAYRTYQWYVDLDDLPRLPRWLAPLAGFRAADHLGEASHPGGARHPGRAPSAGASIRRNVDAYLAGHGIDLGGGTITMLTHARVLGYVFNPLTLFWCHGRDGRLACVIAEVHNTYHQRHCYLLRTDERGRGGADKQFYVSPFYPVAGRYRMTVPEPGERLALAIVLEQPGHPPFVATVRGRRQPATATALLRAALRHPWSTAAVTGRIHWQGIKLYARGLRPQPRPRHLPEEGVQ